MKKVQFTLVFGRKQKDGKGLIELRAYSNGKQKYFSTTIYVQQSEWNKDKKQIIRHPNRDNLNDQLDILIERLEKEQRKAQDNNLDFNLNTVKAFINNEKEKTDSFTEFAFKEIEQDNSLLKVTKYSKLNTVNKILDFNKRETILFDSINYTFCSDFLNFLTGLKYEQSTIQKHHKNFKSLMESAIKKGFYKKKNPLKDITIKVPVKKIYALTWTQILDLENLRFESYESKLELFRDMFLFSCYTGLRVSDIVTLKPEHIKYKDDGVYIEKRAIKTKKNVILPLSKLFPLKDEDTSRPIKILDKYFDENSPLVFKKYCEQVYNRGLKDLAFKARISDINLTSHVGRKTFATYLGNNTQLSTWDLQYLLQHTSIKTTEKYVYTDEKRVNENLNRANWE